jgi:hypothetical protein
MTADHGILALLPSLTQTTIDFSPELPVDSQ